MIRIRITQAMTSGFIFNIQKYSIHDGPGIRTTVFLKGCPLACWWCHNPEGQAQTSETIKFEGRCIKCGECLQVCKVKTDVRRCSRCGACVAVCPAGARQMTGRKMGVDEVVRVVMEDEVFYRESGGGVTFSGGEPLTQGEFLVGLLDACHGRDLHTAVDTCGYVPLDQLLKVAALTDLFLYDLKIMDDARHLEYTGVSNALILDNLRTLSSKHDNIWIRLPIVPGFNDSPGHIEAIADFLVTLSGIRQVNLLPYHEMGLSKGERLGRKSSRERLAPPATSVLEQGAAILRKAGLKALIGG